MEQRRPIPKQQARPIRYKSKLKPAWALVLMDIVIAGIVLLVFAYFQHVNPIFTNYEDGVSLPLPSATITPSPTPNVSIAPTVSPDASPTPTPDLHPFADKFLPAGEEAQLTDTSYISENVNVSIKTVHEYGSDIHVVDIYVRDVTYLKTRFATDDFKTAWSGRTLVEEQAKEVNAFVATNGDQCAARKEGLIIRNGVLVRSKPYRDVCILNYDGTLVTYDEDKFDIEQIQRDGAWQGWAFGPRLLDDNGQPMKNFNTTNAIAGDNPRTAIGMIEPFHYLLVTVDGRQAQSEGIRLTSLSQWFFDQGCTAAYNLDGGATARMAVNGELYSSPSKEREATDIIYIGIE